MTSQRDDPVEDWLTSHYDGLTTADQDEVKDAVFQGRQVATLRLQPAARALATELLGGRLKGRNRTRLALALLARLPALAFLGLAVPHPGQRWWAIVSAALWLIGVPWPGGGGNGRGTDGSRRSAGTLTTRSGLPPDLGHEAVEVGFGGGLGAEDVAGERAVVVAAAGGDQTVVGGQHPQAATHGG